MINEFSKYKSRRELVKEHYELIGDALVEKERGNVSKSNILRERAVNLGLDLVRLDKTNESDDLIQESHLRFLSRCRLLNIDNYVIDSFIGAGKCGAVYKARDLNDETDAALKILFYPRNPEEKERFINEGDKTYELESPHLVEGYKPTKKITGAPIYWYSMELLDESTSLSIYVANNRLKDVLTIMSGVCDGLSVIHKNGLVHRDLHMDNIVITADNTPKILDFGTIPVSDHGFTFRPVGSLKVCSPEKVKSPSTVSAPSDMFSVGCIVYKVASGEWPLYGKNFGEKVQLLTDCDPPPLNLEDEALVQLVDELLRMEPAARPTAEEASSRFSTLAESR